MKKKKKLKAQYLNFNSEMDGVIGKRIGRAFK